MAVAKGTTLYITAGGVSLFINDEEAVSCDATYRPYTFTEDSVVSAYTSEC